MRTVLTATNMPKLNAYLGEHDGIKTLEYDIEYQEELFSKLAIHDPDVLLVTEKLHGPFTKYQLAEELINMKKNMKIIFILKEPEDISYIRYLKENRIRDFFDISDTAPNELIPAILFDDMDREEIRQILRDEVTTTDETNTFGNTEKVKEIIYKEKLLNTYVIGIGTAHRGAGSTYHSLSVANFLSSLDYKVAIIEITKNSGLNFIDTSVFKNRVDIYPFSDKKHDISQQKIISLCNEQKYNYIICDFGVVFNHEYYNEYLRSNFKMLITCGDIWHKNSIDKIKDLPNIQTETFPMIINFSNTDNISKKAKYTYSSIFNVDIFNLTEDQKELYNKVLEPILPKEVNLKRNKLFRLKKGLL